MIRTIIVDDEKNNIEVLKKMLTNYSSKIELIGTAENAEEAYEVIKKAKPQLIFLDIEMPFGNAFDLLEKLMPVDFDVIFFTAFDQYAIKAFRYGALDYLLKPVNVDDLDQAVHKAISRMAEKDINKRLETFLMNMRSDDSALKKIALPTRTGFTFENVQAITHLEASGTYTYVHFNDNRKELTSKILKDFEELLPSSVFCRVHHSYIVNMDYIKKYHKGRGGYIELSNGTTIEVSLRKKPDFLKKFGL